MIFKTDIIAALTSKNNKFACAYAENIISESHETDTWYDCFYEFAALLNHSNSLVRNRALFILAANAQWDDENRLDDAGGRECHFGARPRACPDLRHTKHQQKGKNKPGCKTVFIMSFILQH